MSIIEKNGFKFHEGIVGESDSIVIEDDRIEEYIEYINNQNIKDVTINHFYYEREEVAFLSKCPKVEEVSIVGSLIKDFSGLYELKKVKLLNVDAPDGDLDLSLLDNLEELRIELNKNVKGLTACKKLKVLGLWKYRPKRKNLEELSCLEQIEELIITQSPITSLKGCGRLPKLKKLELNYLTKFETIDEIEKNAQTLKSLRFETCKKIKNHVYVTCLKELELLAFSNCGDIPSIQFIKRLPKLKDFMFVDTNIVDGDLTPCIGLEYVGFTDKRHYSHKWSDFQK